VAGPDIVGVDSGDGALRQRAIVNTLEHDVVALVLKAFHGVADRLEVGWSGTRRAGQSQRRGRQSTSSPGRDSEPPHSRTFRANSNVSALLETERLAPN